MSNKLKIKKKTVSKIAINKECFLLTDIEAEKGRIIKKGQVIHVVDAFIEGNGIFIAFKYKGGIAEAGFSFGKPLRGFSKMEFEDVIITKFVYPVFGKKENTITVLNGNEVVTHNFMYSAPVLE